MKKSIYMLGSVLVLCLFLAACSSKKGENANISINECGNVNVGVIEDDMDVSQNYWSPLDHNFAKAPNGYYYEEYSRLMFFDENTFETYPVCSKINCDHDEHNRECDANLNPNPKDENEGFIPHTVYYYDGLVYLINFNGELVSVSTDGATKKKIAKIFTYDGLVGEGLAFHDGYVYTYNINEHLGLDGEYTEYISKYSLKSGEKTADVISYTGTGSAITDVRCYGNLMFFTVTSVSKVDNAIEWDYKGLYLYNMDTGEYGRVIDDKVVDYVVVPDENQIIYFAKGRGYYSYNIEQKESMQLAEATDENQLVILSYDGRYLYEDNYRWRLTAKRIGMQVDRRCVVYDLALNEVNRLDMSRIGDLDYIYFGNQALLFSQSASDENAHLCIIKNEDGWQYREIK